MGSTRSDLHAITLEIFQFCTDYGIELEVQWIPHTEIDRTDYISCIIDVDDWQISASCFMSLEIRLAGGLIPWIVLLASTATLLVPFWPSSHFGPIISRKFASFIVDYKYFHANSLEHGRNTNSLLGSSRFGGRRFSFAYVFFPSLVSLS